MVNILNSAAAVSILGGSTGLGTGGVIGIDSSLLQGAANSKMNLAAVGQTAQTSAAQANAGAASPEDAPPWEQSAAQLDIADTVGEFLSQGKLIDLNDPKVNREGLSDTDKKLFAVWRGLKTMEALASFSMKEEADPFRNLLDKQFKKYEAELVTFLRENDMEGVTVLGTPLKDEVTAEAIIPRQRTEYKGTNKFSGQNDIPEGLDPNASFTVQVEKTSGEQFDVLVDLSELGGDDRSVAAIIDLANQKLEEAGVVTRFGSYIEEERTGLKIQRSELETVTLVPGSSDSAVYVAGTTGSGDFAKGSLRKFNDVTTDMTQEFDGRTTATQTDPEGEVKNSSLQVIATETGPNGEIYTLGNTVGDLNGQVNTGTQDVYLTKSDAAGNTIWTRMLGASGSATGYSLAVADDGKIAIAGQTDTPLSATGLDNGINTFVTTFDERGEEQWTRNTGPASVDGARAVGFDASGNVYVAGVTAEAFSGQVHGGGNDAFLQRLSGEDGSVQETIQFGDAGDQSASAITIDNGKVYLASNNGNQSEVSIYDAADLAAGPTSTITVGDAGATTRINAIAVDGAGKIYIGGDTSDATLPGAGAAGRPTHSGGTDGFIARLDEAGASIDYGSYLGSTESDRVRDIKLVGNDIFVAGETRGDLQGNTLLGTTQDGFLARLDTDGVVEEVETFAGIGGFADAVGIGVDTSGDSVLSVLGLGRGNIGDIGSTAVTSATSVRPDMTFGISVDDGPVQRIQIEADDSIRWLAFQVNKAIGSAGLASIKKDGLEKEQLEIAARDGVKISISSGSENFDALKGLGLTPTDIYGPDVKDDETVFALGFANIVDLETKKNSEKAFKHTGFALQQIEKAFDQLRGAEEDPLATKRALAAAQAPPAHLASQIASYQKALDFLGNGF